MHRKELAAVMEYASEGEILDAYGYEMITRQQFVHYVDVFRQGESMLENHPPTKDERVCKILFRIRRDILAEQQEWAFSALSPEDVAKQIRVCVRHMHSIKAKAIDELVSMYEYVNALR